MPYYGFADAAVPSADGTAQANQQSGFAAVFPDRGRYAGFAAANAQVARAEVLGLVTSALSSPATGANNNPNNNAPTLIDIDRDGYLEKTAWIAANRSMLAIDANNDGQITPDELLHWGGAPLAVADSTNLR